MKHFGLVLGLSAILFAGNVAAKEYFKWVDDNGVTHFTIDPPKDRPSEKVNTYAGSSSSYDPNAAVSETPEAQAEREQLKNAQDSEKKRNEQTKQECDKAAEQYRLLSNGGRIRIKEKDGTERFLTPEEMTAKATETKKFLEEACKKK